MSVECPFVFVLRRKTGPQMWGDVRGMRGEYGGRRNNGSLGLRGSWQELPFIPSWPLLRAGILQKSRLSCRIPPCFMGTRCLAGKLTSLRMRTPPSRQSLIKERKLKGSELSEKIEAKKFKSVFFRLFRSQWKFSDSRLRCSDRLEGLRVSENSNADLRVN